MEKFITSVGKRKTACARVRIKESQNGTIVINNRTLEQYFQTTVLRNIVYTPLKTIGKENSFAIEAKISGGGLKGQAEALRHGIARALVLWDQELRKTLKTQGLLTRDPRAKERKKPGRRKARRSPQWRKR